MTGAVRATWSHATAPGTGAIAAIHMDGDIDGALAALRIKAVGVGGVTLRNLCGVDEGVVARVADRCAIVMPHGGVGVVRALTEAMTAAGIAQATELDARDLYPEARSDVEARALHALSRTHSEDAIDLLLLQHALWSEPGAASDPARDRVLMRLIDPPLVVVVGPSNIGKSTLTNALAQRAVSIVADEEGTTRDHVGVRLSLAGLVVDWVDTPGLREGAGEEETQARDIALRLAQRADLLVLCGDAARPPIRLATRAESVTVALRCDLARPEWSADAHVSARTGEGLTEFAALVRERLVPPELANRPLPWKFWR